MARKYNHKEFCEAYKKKQPEKSKYVRILGRYVNNSTPIECSCKICGYGTNGEWNPTPNSLMNGRLCPECGRRANCKDKSLIFPNGVDKPKIIREAIENTFNGIKVCESDEFLLNCKSRERIKCHKEFDGIEDFFTVQVNWNNVTKCREPSIIVCSFGEDNVRKLMEYYYNSERYELCGWYKEKKTSKGRMKLSMRRMKIYDKKEDFYFLKSYSDLKDKKIEYQPVSQVEELKIYNVKSIIRKENIPFKLLEIKNDRYIIECMQCNKINNKNSDFLHTEYKRVCSFCSDGISQPQKFGLEVLKQLKPHGFEIIETEKHINYKFILKSGRVIAYVRYDIYFMYNNEIYCLELHGIQHYEEVENFKYTLAEQQEIDSKKIEIAIEKNLINSVEDNYLVCDMRIDDLSFQKNNLINTFSKILNIENLINWELAYKTSFKSYIIESIQELIEMINKGDYDIHKLYKKYNITYETFKNWMKKGIDLKILTEEEYKCIRKIISKHTCIKENKEKKISLIGTPIIHNGIEVIIVNYYMTDKIYDYPSITSVAKTLKVSHNTITNKFKYDDKIYINGYILIKKIKWNELNEEDKVALFLESQNIFNDYIKK